MARNVLTAAQPTIDGATYAFTAVDSTPGNGDAALPGTILLIDNGSGSSLTVTIVSGGSVEGLAVADYTVTVAAGAKRAILVPGGPTWVQPTGTTKGRVHIDYSSATTITRAAVRAL